MMSILKTKQGQKDDFHFYLMILEKLQDFGLTNRESRIYLYLSQSGPKKAKEISNVEKIPRTRTYRILSKMQQKGAIDILNDRPKKFFVHSIEITLDSLIQYEYQKIIEMHKTKKMLIPLWNKAKKLMKPRNKNFINVESAMKKYSNSKKFREEFRQSLKNFKNSNQVYEN